jgi:hypothetical protein
MTSDRQITDDTKEKSNILNKQFQSLFTVEPQDNIPGCTKTHTLKTALPNISTRRTETPT